MTDYYKVAKADGYDWHSGNTINYRTAIGTTIAPPNPQIAPYRFCGRGILHASGTAWGAWHWMINGYGTVRTLDNSSFYVVQGTPVVSMGVEHRGSKHGFLSLYVAQELTKAQFETLMATR